MRARVKHAHTHIFYSMITRTCACRTVRPTAQNANVCDKALQMLALCLVFCLVYNNSGNYSPMRGE